MPNPSVPSPSRSAAPPPYVLSLIVCEKVLVDKATGNHTLVDVFSEILAPSFPAIHPRLAVFLELTNGHGTGDVEVRLVDAATDEPALSVRGPISFPDPRMVARLNVTFGNPVFKKPGEYRFQVWFERALLTERRFLVRLLNLRGESQ